MTVIPPLKKGESPVCRLIKQGHKWQKTHISGSEKKFYYFSPLQWVLLVLSVASLYFMEYGLSKEVASYIISAFSISITLFMSLLISIFDKFEKTDFSVNENTTDKEIDTLTMKKNFFKQFISITSYLVVIAVFIVALCSLIYIFDLSAYRLTYKDITFDWERISIEKTLCSSAIFIYRIALNYFITNYLSLTLFITVSAYEYYIGEIANKKIKRPSEK